MIILGIDTSCDDTSIALVRDGQEIIADIVSSQIEVHRLFGGVVPELASRKHIELIDLIYKTLLEEAHTTGSAIDGIAVTAGPGLIGSILVGLCFAKGLAVRLGKPLIAINHIHAHIMSIFLERKVDFPFVALVVSGGHTVIVSMKNRFDFTVVGSTRDDAAGEAFDKVAKYLGIGYPGGKVIEELSKEGRKDFVHFPRPMMDDATYDFSFSGLKTAMVNYVKKHAIPKDDLPSVLSSFQEAVFDVLAAKTLKAARAHGAGRIVVGGGVASNGRLREVFEERGTKEGIETFFSSPRFCTDNAAMVALVGHCCMSEGRASELDIRAFSRMSLR